MSLKHIFLFLISLIASIPAGFALDPGYYAPSSKLSQGRWSKVAVKETGMQFISNATLKGLGFSNPDRVNIYGYGGKMLPERLDQSVPDDIPLIPSIRTAGGVVFFGVASVGWEQTKEGTFRHIANPYSDNSYYFISDSEAERPALAVSEEVRATAAEPITIFTERLLHEQDILAPSTTGRVILGEDFRTQRTRSFNFQLPGNTGDAKISFSFGAKVSGGNSTLNLNAKGNGENSSTFTLQGVTSSETFLSRSSFNMYSENTGEKLTLTLNYSNTGTLFTAALDYIEVTYPRALRMTGDELYFYLSPSEASEVRLEGCNDQTVIWDVTDPVRPLAVEFEKEGSVCKFNTPAGLREYIAFSPARVTRAATGAGSVRNQDLHGMEAPGMLVVAPEQFKIQAQKIADIHAATDGLQVTVVTPEEVYNEFSSGKPDVTAFRRLLKMWYDRGGASGEYTKYCLLFSRPTYDNKMGTPVVKRASYPRIPIWQEPDSYTEAGSYSTDDYIGMLDDQPEQLNIGKAKIHVAVGRMPVKNVAEAENAVAKLERYLLNPSLGTWRNNVMVIADDQDNAQHLDQAERVVNALRDGANGANMIYEKLYLDAYPLGQSGQGAIYPEAKKRMLDKIEEGVSLVNYIGHANPRSWGHENLLTWTDITNLNNPRLPFIYAATCEFLYWDADDVSGAEELWLKPAAGVIGMICPSRKVYISANGVLNEKTAKWFFSKDKNGLPLPLGEIMINGKNDCPNETNKLRYAFMGDPSMRLPYPSYSAYVDKINGFETISSDFPELKARSRVELSGRICDNKENLMEDFNGTLDIQLYDAEKVVETYGNGSDGEVRTYNDRKTRLYIGRANVKNGIWSTSFVMPSEIENNYSPALISLYGYNEAGEEANGSSERLYVYGYEYDTAEDNEGPVITDFYLNNISFTSGNVIGPNPTLFATLSDISGINLSEAGIGHKMTVSLDNKEWFDDVNLYYTPDSETFEKGVIVYPLKGITPGDHTLNLTVWDTANNSSSASLSFSVRADWKPSISTLTTDVNPASTSVMFTVEVDGASGEMPCMIEVFDLTGRRVWYSEESGFSENNCNVNRRWDLHDTNGHRLARGIYLYRATVTTPEGHVVRTTRKLAVTAG